MAIADSRVADGEEMKQTENTKQNPRFSVLSKYRDETELKGIEHETKLIQARIKLVNAKAALKKAKGEPTKNITHPVKSHNALPTQTGKPTEKKIRALPRKQVISNPLFKLLEIYGTDGAGMSGLIAVIRVGKEVARGGIGSQVMDGWNIHAITPVGVVLKKREQTIRIGLSSTQ